jgi:hypothetical protein
VRPLVIDLLTGFYRRILKIPVAYQFRTCENAPIVSATGKLGGRIDLMIDIPAGAA